MRKEIFAMKNVTSKENRICKFANCNQILSIYNHEVYCYTHQKAMANTKPAPSPKIKKD